jgi:hypothetical protein
MTDLNVANATVSEKLTSEKDTLLKGNIEIDTPQLKIKNDKVSFNSDKLDEIYQHQNHSTTKINNNRNITQKSNQVHSKKECDEFNCNNTANKVNRNFKSNVFSLNKNNTESNTVHHHNNNLSRNFHSKNYNKNSKVEQANIHKDTNSLISNEKIGNKKRTIVKVSSCSNKITKNSLHSIHLETGFQFQNSKNTNTNSGIIKSLFRLTPFESEVLDTENIQMYSIGNDSHRYKRVVGIDNEITYFQEEVECDNLVWKKVSSILNARLETLYQQRFAEVKKNCDSN